MPAMGFLGSSYLHYFKVLLRGWVTLEACSLHLKPVASQPLGSLQAAKVI